MRNKIFVYELLLSSIVDAREVLEKKERGWRLNEWISFLTFISGIVIPIVIPLILLPDVIRSISNTLQHDFLYFIFAYLILSIFIIVILIRWSLNYLLPEIRTYLAIVFYYEFVNKENIVYQLLNDIQKFVITNDKNIQKLMDDSFYNFIIIFNNFLDVFLFKNKKL